MIPANAAECEYLILSWQKGEMFYIVTCVFFCVFFHSLEESQTAFGQKRVYLPVCVFLSRRNSVCVCVWECVPAGVQRLVLSNSCLMFYALLTESDDTAADSPLSQQPLISIALCFNLLYSPVYTLPLSLSLPLLHFLPLGSLSSFFLLQNCEVLH